MAARADYVSFTPRSTARIISSRRPLSGRKYGVVISTLSLALASSVWNSMRARVDWPDVRLLSITSVTLLGRLFASKQKYSSSVRSSPDASNQFSTNVACMDDDGVTLDAAHRVAPARALSLRDQPMVRESCSAHERHLAVDDENFAVRSAVQSRQLVPLESVIPLDAAAGVFQFFEVAVPRCEAADRVQNDVDLDASSGPFRERLHESPRHFTLLEYVRFQIDAALRFEIACSSAS